MATEPLALVETPEPPATGKRIGFKEAIGIQDPFLKRQAELLPQISEAKGDVAKAKQAQAEILATGKQQAAETRVGAERAARDRMTERVEAEPLPAFVPTQDTVQDIAGLFSLIGVLGMVAGKGDAMRAMNAMNGMLEGHRKGRKDLYQQERQTFEKNFQSMLKKHEEFRKEMEDAIKTAETDYQAGMAKAELAAAKAGATIVQAELRQGRLVDAYKFVEESKQGRMQALDLEAKARQAEAAERAAAQRHKETLAQQMELAKMRMSHQEKMTGLKSVGGARSAINERYANNVFRSGNEVLRSLELIEQIGVSTGSGALGSVVGKGTIPSEVQRYIGQAMTEEQQRNYNTAMSGVAFELAMVLGGGYKPDVSMVNKLETLLSVGPNDTPANAAYKFSDVAAKLKAAIEVSPAFTEDQKKTRSMLIDKLDKYATPEVVYERQYAVPERKESAVRAGSYPTPQTQAEFDALEPGTEYIDPDDGKLYKKKRK